MHGLIGTSRAYVVYASPCAANSRSACRLLWSSFLQIYPNLAHSPISYREVS